MTPGRQATPMRVRPWRLGRVERTASLLIGLLLAGSILAACHPGRAGEPPAPPTQPTQATQASGPPTPLGGCGQALSELGHRVVGHRVEGPGEQRFEVTRQQLSLIGSHLIEVFCRQGLWQQDVGFGVHYGKDRTRILVLINPGRSGLTAKQVLDRLLGRG